MLSIIICSISQEKLSQVKANIAKTIGVEYEVIAIDNLKCKYSITKAYNEGARKAKYPFLLFVHEDVLFHSSHWGSFIEDKLKEPDCGIIGFAGSKMLMDVYSGWTQSGEWESFFLFQKLKTGKTVLHASNVDLHLPFEEVISLDGLAMFVRKDVWEEFLFDEVHLTGFHCYDLDFSLRVASSKKYKNYVSTSFNVVVEHLSPGNYNKSWYVDTVRMFRTQWKGLLPLSVEGFEVNKKNLEKKKERCFWNFIKPMMEFDCEERKQLLLEFLSYPLSWKHFSHCVSLFLLYIRNNK